MESPLLCHASVGFTDPVIFPEALVAQLGWTLELGLGIVLDCCHGETNSAGPSVFPKAFHPEYARGRVLGGGLRIMLTSSSSDVSPSCDIGVFCCPCFGAVAVCWSLRGVTHGPEGRGRGNLR